MVYTVGHYLGDDWEVVKLPRWWPGQENLEESLQFIRHHVPEDKPFWLVYSRPFHGDPDGHLLDALLAERKIELRGRFDGICLYQGKEIDRTEPH